MNELEAVVGVNFSREEFGQEKADIDDENERLWIPLLEHRKVTDITRSIADRNAELHRIRSTIFSTKPRRDAMRNIRFLAWCHTALELVLELASRSTVGGPYGTALVEAYLGSIVQYFQACLLTDIKRARAELAIH
jgi:hypothetical protein